ncbi:MAG TPA: HAD family hydrolase [Stellaceae bacterium]|nr:HAD family hydrolase [Stellaceae bacterium]
MAGGKGLILDRDGVINLDIGYLHRIEDCVFVDGIFELLHEFQARGFRLVIATNQSGIGRGLFTEADFERLTDWMRARFRERGVVIDAVYCCPDHPTEGIGCHRRESNQRKPAPGMILEAIHDLGLDPAASWAIGDRERDIQAASAAGIGTLILIDPGGVEEIRPDGVTVVRTLGAVGALLARGCEDPGVSPNVPQHG